MDLLDDYPENSNVNTGEIEDNKRIIVESLGRYRIASEVSNVTRRLYVSFRFRLINFPNLFPFSVIRVIFLAAIIAKRLTVFLLFFIYGLNNSP